jgi:ribonuclease HI
MLRSSGITLNDSSDKLVWSWNGAMGTVSANLAYQSISFMNLLDENKWWYKAIWKVRIPGKIICFMWLCLKDCILTGANYRKRGGIGPSVCSLCLRGEETTTHLFVHCATSQSIWKEVLSYLKFPEAWYCSSLEDNLVLWFTKYPKMRHIPFLVIWGLWKYRNKILFENMLRQDSRIVTNILLSISELNEACEVDNMEVMFNPIYFDDSPIGFFDGASVDGVCGIGFFLKINPDHLFRGHFAGGKGNNMKEEIMGLWGLLHFATGLSINKMMVVGDSKVAIDWINDKSNLNLLYLDTWKGKIKRLKDSFEVIKFMHVHRKYNSEADFLSKKSLDCPTGWLFFEESIKGVIVKADKYFIL